ncbi:hypothetical protein PFLUV_G00104650 [Perca fluviatilis]|uniref:Uncharacterized protein n=1 Tax=Perca fluviatilis TaxID=8168 RepID=A0A6A5FG60_PERFL|nr:hypothetical protein PFLUV_G00104650 [Perca fluviatilis]
MGTGVSQKEYPVEESPPPPQSNTESDSAHSSPPRPAIIVTAPSREDLYASPSTVTIADAIKERRPSSTPFVVGNKFMANR